MEAFVPRQALVSVYKAFIRSHLDYGDVLYDQAFNDSPHAKMESIQYYACLSNHRSDSRKLQEKKSTKNWA